MQNGITTRLFSLICFCKKLIILLLNRWNQFWPSCFSFSSYYYQSTTEKPIVIENNHQWTENRPVLTENPPVWTTFAPIMIERQPKVIEKLPILVENQNILTEIQEKRSILPDLSNRPIFVTPSSFMETSTTTSITTTSTPTPTPTPTRPTRHYVHSTTQKAKSYNHFSNKKKISDYDPRKARATTAQPYEVRSLLTWWAFANES